MIFFEALMFVAEVLEGIHFLFELASALVKGAKRLAGGRLEIEWDADDLF